MTGISPRNGIWFPDCGGDPEPGVFEFQSLEQRDASETRSATTIQDFIRKVWNGDLKSVDAAIDALVHRNYKRHYEAKVLEGRDKFKTCVREMRASHPGLYITLLRMIPSYNLVGTSIHIRWSTARLYEMRAIEIYRLHDDLIVESWHTMQRAGAALPTIA